MTLQGLSIKKLFGQFDYDISLVNHGGIVILTGPNGYGKTTILNIINSLFMLEFNYFQALNFKSIEYIFSNNRNIIVTKGKQDTINQRIIQLVDGQQQITTCQPKIFVEICLELQTNSNLEEKYVYTPREENKLLQSMVNGLPFPDIVQHLPLYQTVSGFEFDPDDLRLQLQKKAFNIIFPNQTRKEQKNDLKHCYLHLMSI
jgi:hypothetical protein